MNNFTTTKNPSELTEQEESIFEKNIVWLFGSPRGGTTWVARQLLSHNTNSINEPHIEEHLSMRAFSGNAPFTRRIDNPQKNPEYFFSKDYKTVWMKFLRKLILNRFFAQTNDINKITIVKEPCTIGATDIITECMKESKVIVLLRDGRDVLDSIFDAVSKNGFMTKTTGAKPTANKMNFIKNQSKLWVHKMEHILNTYNNLPSHLKYIVKYEDLLKDTPHELEKIYHFLNIDISKNEIQNIVEKFDFNNIPSDKKGPGKFFRSASPGKWKDHFNEEEQCIVQEIMENTLKKLGY